MKILLYLSVFIFSTIGAYIPALWGAGIFSLSGIFGGLVGTVVGIWVALKLNNLIDV